MSVVTAHLATPLNIVQNAGKENITTISISGLNSSAADAMGKLNNNNSLWRGSTFRNFDNGIRVDAEYTIIQGTNSTIGGVPTNLLNFSKTMPPIVKVGD